MSIVTRKYTMAAGAEVSFSRKADFLRCLYSTGTISVEFDDGADSGELEAGLAYFPEGGFSRVRLVNNTAASVSITVAVGKGTMEDNRATVNTGQTLPTRESAPDLLTGGTHTITAGNYDVISAANSLRREITIINTTAGDLYVDNAFPLPNGAALTLKTSAEVKCYSAAGTTLHWIETVWSA